VTAPGPPIITDFLQDGFDIDGYWSTNPYPRTPPFVTVFWDYPTFIGSSQLAGPQIQVSTDIEFLTNTITFASPRVVGQLFQFGNVLANTFTCNAITNNTVHYARVRARNGNVLTQGQFLATWTEDTSIGSYGPWSEIVGVVVGLVPPQPPTSVTVNSFFAGSALVAFTPATQNPVIKPVTSFRIEYSKDPTFATGLLSASVDPEINNRLFTGLDQGEVYYFRVFAVNDDGNSTPSAVVSVNVVLELFPRESTIDSPGTYDPVFYSLAGHVAGFDVNGRFVPGVETDLDYEVRLYTPTTNAYEIIGNNIYAKNVTTDTLYFVPNPISPSISSLNAIRFKTILSGENCSVSWVGNPSFPSVYGGKDFDITIDYEDETLTATSEYSLDGTRVQTTGSASLSTIDLNEEIAVTVQYQRVSKVNQVTLAVTYEYDLLVSVCPVSDFSAPVSVLLEYETDARDAVTQRVQIAGNIRSLCVSNNLRTLGPDEVFEYERNPEYAIDGNFSLSGSVPSLIGNVWDYVQDAATSSRAEVSVVDNLPTARNIGVRLIDITNIAPQPNITPTTASSGQAIDVSYTNASILSQGLLYYSLEDNNRIFTASFGEDITTTVETPGSPSFVQQPILIEVEQYLTYIEAGSFPFSVYGIIDQTGLPILPQQWADYEGLLEVSINTQIPNSINVRLKGPRQEIPGTTAPYSVAYSSGEGADSGALAIIGSGVLFDIKNVEILTGAPTDRVTRVTATTINNPFINTLEQAYDLGSTAADIAAGPNVTLTGTIPVSAIEGFGFVAGSLIQYRDNIYRVNDATIGNLSVEFSATEYVTVGQFDSLWGDIDVSVHDDLWGENQVQDQKIFPFREVGYPEIGEQGS
jgi:hypothetical protein